MLDDLKARLPETARDLRLNLDTVLAAPALSPGQAAGVALASALAAGEGETIRVMAARAGEAGPAVVKAARVAAALMAMNNVYYRFTHLVEAEDYRTMRPGLRMQAMANPGVAKEDFELMALAVSAINGCGMCMDGHEKMLRKAGASSEAVQAAVRIAAVVAAVARTIAAEAALPDDLAEAA